MEKFSPSGQGRVELGEKGYNQFFSLCRGSSLTKTTKVRHYTPVFGVRGRAKKCKAHSQRNSKGPRCIILQGLSEMSDPTNTLTLNSNLTFQSGRRKV